MGMAKSKAKPEFAVAVPEQAWVILGARGGAKVFLDGSKAQNEWGRQQQRRNDQLAKGKDTGTDPLVVKFVPDIARPKSKPSANFFT